MPRDGKVPYLVAESAGTNAQDRTMAGALSESAPRPVSIVAVNDTAADDVGTNNRAGANRAQVRFRLIYDNRKRLSCIRILRQIYDVICFALFQEARDNIRFFTSTEAQTELALDGAGDELATTTATAGRTEVISDGVRDAMARRRERRVRRQHRRALRSCTVPPTYPTSGCQTASSTAPGVPLMPPNRGFLHPPPPHLGLRGLSLGLPFPVPASVSAFGR